MLIIVGKAVIMKYGEVQKEKQRLERRVVIELNRQGSDSLGERISKLYGSC